MLLTAKCINHTGIKGTLKGTCILVTAKCIEGIGIC